MWIRAVCRKIDVKESAGPLEGVVMINRGLTLVFSNEACRTRG